MSKTELSEIEQKIQQEVLENSSLRHKRKVIRTAITANSKEIALSQSRDAIMFEGVSYNLIFAHGNLQVERTFKVALRKNGRTSEQKQEIYEQIKKLVKESSLAKSNIHGSPSAGEFSITKKCKE